MNYIDQIVENVGRNLMQVSNGMNEEEFSYFETKLTVKFLALSQGRHRLFNKDKDCRYCKRQRQIDDIICDQPQCLQAKFNDLGV